MLRGWDIAGIITVRVSGDDSMMFQVPTTSLVGLQAFSADLPWLPVTLAGNENSEMMELENAIENVISGSNKPRSPTWSKSERAAADWPETWKWPSGIELLQPNLPIDAVVVGALRSDYQKTRIEQMCQRLGIHSYTPLWHHGPEQHMIDLIDHGFEIMITSVTSDGLGEEWLGQVLTISNFEELRELSKNFRFNVDGEGGEYETAVISAPWMQHRISTRYTAHWTGARGWIDIWSAELIEI